MKTKRNFLMTVGLCLSLLFVMPQNVGSATPVCPDFGDIEIAIIFPHPTNCHAYYECDNGVARLMECPDDLLFDNKKLVCTFAWAIEDCGGYGTAITCSANAGDCFNDRSNEGRCWIREQGPIINIMCEFSGYMSDYCCWKL